MQFFSPIFVYYMKFFAPMNNLEKKELAADVKEKTGAKSVSININNNKRIPLPPNIMVFQTFAFLAATKLKPSSNKVLMLFFSGSEYENYVGMDVVSISEKLEISERSVISSLKELEKHNIIIKTTNPRDRRRNDYFLNPYSAWKGNSESRKRFMQIIPENQISMFGIKGFEHSQREKIEIQTGTQYTGE